MKIMFFKNNRHFWLLSASLAFFLAQACEKINVHEGESAHAPTKHAQNTTEKSEKKFAKNVILFIGDGMGVSTITAARIFDGESNGLKRAEHGL